MLSLKKFQLETFILKHDPLGAIAFCIILYVTQLQNVARKDGKLLMPSLLPTLIHFVKELFKVIIRGLKLVITSKLAHVISHKLVVSRSSGAECYHDAR